jgi:hypothetical protein
MDIESMRLKVQHCEERAEQAKRDDGRQQWRAAADSWRLAIKARKAVPNLIVEWSSLKSGAAG